MIVSMSNSSRESRGSQREPRPIQARMWVECVLSADAVSVHLSAPIWCPNANTFLQRFA